MVKKKPFHAGKCYNRVERMRKASGFFRARESFLEKDGKQGEIRRAGKNPGNGIDAIKPKDVLERLDSQDKALDGGDAEKRAANSRDDRRGQGAPNSFHRPAGHVHRHVEDVGEPDEP